MPLNEWHVATYIYDFTAKITKPHGKKLLRAQTTVSWGL